MRSLAPRTVLAGVAILSIVAASCGGDKASGPSGPPTQLIAVSATGFGGKAGTTAAESLGVLAKNASGVRPNVVVTFTLVSGGGVLSSTTATTNSLGVAKVRWVFGGVLGVQTVKATVDTITPVLFNANVTAGSVVLLTAQQGSGQSAAANAVLPVSPQVKATDSFGNPVAGETIIFTSTTGVNELTGVTQVTNAGGLATLGGWTLGPCAGAVSITAASTTSALAVFSATVTGGGTYCIELVYTVPPDPVMRAAAERAAATWSRTITADFPIENVTAVSGTCASIPRPAINRDIKAVLIYVQLAPIASSTPGLVTLGSASPCFVRDGNGLTILGGVRLNSEYLLANLTAVGIEDIVLHEMGHVLGIGTLWSGVPGTTLPVLLQNPAPTGVPFFTGASAISAYIGMGGPPGSTNIPVESCGGGGTINGHWRESVFGTELMTGYASAPAGQRNPLSVMTILSLQDMGYTVGLSQAAPYTVAGQPCPVALLFAPPGAIVVGGQVVIEELGEPTHIVRHGHPEPIVHR